MSNEEYYWPRYWYHKRKVNVVPFDTKNRKSILKSYEEYQNKRIPLDLFNQWLKDGLFDKGMAIFPGKIYSDDLDHNLYLVVLDFDKKEGLEEFCKYGSRTMTKQAWADQTILEQHLGNLDRAHIYLLSPIPFPNKGADTILGIEVKSKGEHGIIFSTNSLHRDGTRYQIIGSDEPCILSKVQAIEMIQHINTICAKYGLEYVNKKVPINTRLKKVIKNLRIPENTEGIKIFEGERHNAFISIGNSILFRHLKKDEGDNIVNEDKLRTFFKRLNQELCEPEPLSQDEEDSIWTSCIRFVESVKVFNNDDKQSYYPLDKEKTASFIEEATERILENHHFITLEETKEILYYKNGVYVVGGEVIIEKEAENMFGYDLANKHLSEIKGHIIRKTYHKREELDADVSIINLQNGLYDISNNTLKQHSPNYLSVNQKPIVYDPNAKPTYFWKFLKDVLYSIEIRTAVEAMAYTFYRDTPFEYFFKLFGYGSNGKSVFTGLLTKLHDPKNISNVSISSLLENRFALADLEFKDVNIDTELSNTIIKDTSILKKLTGGRKQQIRIERKNQQAYDAYLHAKLFFNANVNKETLDQSAAYYRREVIISFPFIFAGKRDDPYFLNKLSSQEEISGIFNVLMVALRRILRNNGIFINEKTVEERRKKSERLTDPVKVFKEEAIAEDSTADEWITKADLYSTYIKFCNKYKIAIKSIEPFGKDLKRLGIEDGKRTKDHERKTCWLGVKLTREYQFDIENQRQMTFSMEDESGVA